MSGGALALQHNYGEGLFVQAQQAVFVFDPDQQGHFRWFDQSASPANSRAEEANRLGDDEPDPRSTSHVSRFECQREWDRELARCGGTLRISLADLERDRVLRAALAVASLTDSSSAADGMRLLAVMPGLTEYAVELDGWLQRRRSTGDARWGGPSTPALQTCLILDLARHDASVWDTLLSPSRDAGILASCLVKLRDVISADGDPHRSQALDGTVSQYLNRHLRELTLLAARPAAADPEARDALASGIATLVGRIRGVTADAAETAITALTSDQQDALPELSLALISRVVAETTRANDTSPEGQATLGRWLSGRAWAERRQGLMNDAREDAASAVDLLRGVLETDRIAYTPRLVDALANQYLIATDLGNHGLALRAITEALSLTRRLSAVDPEGQRWNLAMVLSCHTAALIRNKRAREALVSANEAVALWEGLTAMNPRETPHLVAAMQVRAQALECTGDKRQALASVRNALEIARAAHEAGTLDDERLAHSHGWLALMATRAKERHLALAAATSAAELYRGMPHVSRQDRDRLLGESLFTRGWQLQALGRYPEAADAFQEAADLIRPAATSSAEAKVSMLLTLSNLGWAAMRCGRPGVAAGAAAEFAKIYGNSARHKGATIVGPLRRLVEP